MVGILLGGVAMGNNILGLYILDADGMPVPAPNPRDWAMWIRQAQRGDPPAVRIAFDKIGDANVSTVFLGMDHSFGLGLEPILWETMVFGGQHDGEFWRYSSRGEALAGHWRAVRLVHRSQHRWRPGHSHREGR